MKKIIKKKNLLRHINKTNKVIENENEDPHALK